MSDISQFLNAGVSLKAIQARGPGSNGYWRREMWMRPGSFSFTVKKTGKHKIYALGAGGGAGFDRAGSSAGISIDERSYTAGDVITVTVGAGGIGNAIDQNGGDGGTTTVVCAARSLNLTLAGGVGGRSNGTGQTAGTASGGNVANYAGAIGQVSGGVYLGGPASASPIGPAVVNTGRGGGGWGGVGGLASGWPGGASSHFPSSAPEGAPGLTAKGGMTNTSAPQTQSLTGDSREWWDLLDADSGGGGANSYASGAINGGAGGFGAGGGSTANGTGGFGGFGGGGGCSGSNGGGGNGGNGGGGGRGPSIGGNGGAGAVIIYWDEVA